MSSLLTIDHRLHLVLLESQDIIASLHNASLLVDDIEDSSKLRRGVPCAHTIYGIANTINCANYVFFLALEKCHTLQSKPAMDVFVLELLNLHRGQGQDILWREECRCPTGDTKLNSEQNIILMIKTAYYYSRLFWQFIYNCSKPFLCYVKTSAIVFCPAQL